MSHSRQTGVQWLAEKNNNKKHLSFHLSFKPFQQHIKEVTKLERNVAFHPNQVIRLSWKTQLDDFIGSYGWCSNWFVTQTPGTVVFERKKQNPGCETGIWPRFWNRSRTSPRNRQENTQILANKNNWGTLQMKYEAIKEEQYCYVF